MYEKKTFSKSEKFPEYNQLLSDKWLENLKNTSFEIILNDFLLEIMHRNEDASTVCSKSQHFFNAMLRNSNEQCFNSIWTALLLKREKQREEKYF